MKKIFTLILGALASVSAWAAAPQLLFGDQPVTEGVTYTTGYTVEEMDLGGIILRNYIQNSDLFLRGENGADVTVEVTASSNVAVCSITGQCTNGTEVTKSGTLGAYDVVSTEGNNVTVDLKIEYQIQDMNDADPSTLLQDITVEVKAYYTSTPNEVVTAKVLMSKLSASEVGGIGSVVNDGVKIGLGYGNVIEYTVAKPTKFALYSIAGNLVMSRLIASTGSINLDSLHPGIYIFSAGGKTGKIIVRK